MENRPAAEAITWIMSQAWSDSYKKMYLSALKHRETGNDTTKIAEAIKGLAVKTQAKEKAQKLTAKESEKYVAWPEIVKARESLKAAGGWDYLLACLYTMTPPVRNDYANMMVLRTTPTKSQIAKHKAAGFNLCVLLKKSAYFLFLNYKTASTYGDVKLKIPKQLGEVIRHTGIWVGDGQMLLNGMTEAYVGIKLARIFQRAIGKSVTINILRHSYVTHMRHGEMPLAEKEELAKHMMHSALEGELYIKHV
jgi:hypothetical protein